VPVIDMHPLGGDRLRENQLRIQLAYPTAQFFKGVDPRGEDRVRAALAAGGKLAAAESHTDWVARSLREIQTIKPGLTRGDLLMQRRFAYRECPYIKVDVNFEPVGDLDKSTESPHDKIVKISQPFLEWSISD
jgi:hypothetical protein